MKFQAILLLGPTGSGKSPLGDWLEQVSLCGRRCHHFDFGANLRAVVAGGGAGTFSANEMEFLRRVLDKGALLDDEQFPLAARILDAFIEQKGVSPNDLLVLNGLPRHLNQARAVDRKLTVVGVVQLDCDAATVAERLRRNSGGDRSTRRDDDEALVARKLKIYEERTRPLLDYYREQGVRVLKVPVKVKTQPSEITHQMEDWGKPAMKPLPAHASNGKPSTELGGNSGIKAIIFDAEGVIVDTESMWDEAQEEFLRLRGIPYNREKLKRLLSGKSQRDAIETLKAECGLSGDTQLLANERMELVRRQLAEGVNFVSGFPEFFQRVQPDYRTAVGTAMAEELLAIVDARLGLSRLFDGRIYSLSAVGYRSKPNPDIFLYTADRLEVEPANCLVIEDAPHGVEAARRAGMKCVALTTTFDRLTLSRADCVVDSFAQIELAGL